MRPIVPRSQRPVQGWAARFWLDQEEMERRGSAPATLPLLDTMYIMSNQLWAEVRQAKGRHRYAPLPTAWALAGCNHRNISCPSSSPAMPSTKPAAVAQAERKVAAVLDDLEQTTGSEVRKLQLEDVVASDAVTGRPLVQKAVEITVQPKPARKWAR